MFCTPCGKNGYRTWKFANEMKKKAWEDRGNMVRVYPCSRGGGFHLTRMHDKVVAKNYRQAM